MKKIILDNVLESITIEDKIIYELIKTKEFNRLNRINHLGFLYFLFPTAVHTRYSHSLGTYEIARRFLKKLNENNSIDYFTILSIKIAALLHDIGHGMFSHTFEMVSKKPHEDYTIEIIESPNTEINKILKKYDERLIENVKLIIKKEHPNIWVNKLISSEIDVDRLDYLMRDSLMAGVKYGQIDLKWLIKNTFIVEDKLVFYEKALPTVESIIFARYHMNTSLYNNAKSVALSSLFFMLFENLKKLFKEKKLICEYPLFENLMKNQPLSLNEFLDLDDSAFYQYLNKIIKNEKDKTLLKIANLFLRNSFPEIIKDADKIQERMNTLNPNDKGLKWDKVKLKIKFKDYNSEKKDQALIYNFNRKISSLRNLSSILIDSNKKNIEREILILV